MSKKHFIALAELIRDGAHSGNVFMFFSQDQINALADFCKAQNHNFDRSRWLSYIAGECGPNGGKVVSK